MPPANFAHQDDVDTGFQVRGHQGHFNATMKDERPSWLGKWETDGIYSNGHYTCWVRRLGGEWKRLGCTVGEMAAYELYLRHPDLAVDVLVLRGARSDPNNLHRAAA